MSNSKHWQGGSTRAWRKVRAYVLRRDSFRCQVRMDGCTVRATCVHHLDGKALGDDPSRLVASCNSCNQAIGDPARTVPDPPLTETRTPW